MSVKLKFIDLFFLLHAHMLHVYMGKGTARGDVPLIDRKRVFVAIYHKSILSSQSIVQF